MTYTPSPEEFMMQPADPNEDAEPDAFAYVNPSDHTPLYRLADVERRLAQLEGNQPDTFTPGLIDFSGLAHPAENDRLPVDESLADLQELADLEAKHDVVLQLVEQIRGIVKKSTSKVSLDVKAAIDAWANPLGTQTPSPAPDAGTSVERSDSDPDSPSSAAEQPASAGEGSHTRTPTEAGPDFCKECSDAMGAWVMWPCGLAQPAHDADVEEWRTYAKLTQDAIEGTVIDLMNRSQIRTMLGIEQPAGA